MAAGNASGDRLLMVQIAFWAWIARGRHQEGTVLCFSLSFALAEAKKGDFHPASVTF